MKNLLLCLLLAVSFGTHNPAVSVALLNPQPSQLQAAHIAAEVLTRHHYKRISLDDATSSKIFDQYLKMLDGEKVFFLQSDIDHFAYARTTLDDAILNENLKTPFAIYNLYQQRITDRIAYARSLLTKGFDFKDKESYQASRKNAPWPQSKDEMNDLWHKRVKNDWLRLKLTGKDDKSIAETLARRYDNMLKSISRVNSNDVFQSFMNAYAMAIDPHTNYFGVRASEEFDISMKLSLVGIGAVLQDKEEYTTIRELVAGGPAALSGKLKIGDRIVGVGQGANSIPTDVMGWRIDDTVALIRGAEDSTVLLDVLPVEAGPDSKHKLIALVRKKINLDKQAARKSIIEVKDGSSTRHIGIITLPGFYQDFSAHQNGDKEYKSATRDVARLLEELKKDKIDSVLIDLRNNGGGSLLEAIELTGLFIDQGPVVQQRDSNGVVNVERDVNAGFAWDGPLGVLINRGSASASEIFAAAIQDYGRGVIIGETSFGKGTVQAVVSLDHLMKKEKQEFGELKMTVAQFFRINGGTTQMRGVTPDISLPTMIDAEDFGESSYENALPWTQIKQADFKPAGDLTEIFPMLKRNHDVRVSRDKDFQYLREDIAELIKLRKTNLISLNEADRRKERDSHDVQVKSRAKSRESGIAVNALHKESVASKAYAFQDDGLMSSERNIDADLAIESAKKNSKDILLNEAANILSDEVGLLKINAKLLASVFPKSELH